ncbi:MAG: primase catalytic core domain protein [Actinomycetia bacterium]|nr:primase catalytic core domain protein [Actinomycetes bacterium]
MRYQGCVAVREALLSETLLADVVVDARIERSGGSLEFFEQRWAAATAAAHLIARLPPDQIARQVTRVAVRLDLHPGTVTDAVAVAAIISPATHNADGFPLPPLTLMGEPSMATRPSAPNPDRLRRST